MEFIATLLQSGKTATGFEVPAAVVESLGAGRRVAVTATIGQFSYRTTVAPMGGVFMMPLSRQRREAAGIDPGDQVTIDLVLDTEPRELEIPSDLAAALDAHPVARTAFDALSHSNRQRHVLAVQGAKTDATRVRRVAGVITALSG